MKWVRKDDNQCIPIKSWCDPIDDNALAQAMNLSRHPAAAKHVALINPLVKLKPLGVIKG